jgi:hypothetical protein
LPPDAGLLCHAHKVYPKIRSSQVTGSHSGQLHFAVWVGTMGEIYRRFALTVSDATRTKGYHMTVYRSVIMVAGMVLAVSMAHINPSPAMAAENDNAVAIAPELSGDGSDVVVKPKKSKKKEPPPEPELLPGQKLTLKQVMNILRSTRNLSGRNLSGLKLTGVDLSRCNLRGVDLKHADLERADLGEANLELADLSGANLKMANLRLSAMTGVKLDSADLSGAIWRDSRVCAPASVGQCREMAATSP